MSYNLKNDFILEVKNKSNSLNRESVQYIFDIPVKTACQQLEPYLDGYASGPEKEAIYQGKSGKVLSVEKIHKIKNLYRQLIQINGLS